MLHEVSDLKPCPFCGSEAYIWSWNYGTAVQCSKFNANTHLVQIRGETSDLAIKRWNHRADEKEGEEE